MNEIQQPANIALVRPRDEGHGQGNGREPSGRPPKKVAEAYQENAKAEPVDDRITILGIPAEQITPATQAALASLVNEVNFLRANVRRLEAGSPKLKRDAKASESEVIPADLLPSYLSRIISEPLQAGVVRVLTLMYLSTFEDVRRSSGLLAANSLLADLAQRAVHAEFAPASENGAGTPVAHSPGLFKFRLVGYAGGSSLVGLAELPAGTIDETYISRQVRDHCIENGFNVGGIDMAVALSVAAVVMSSNEGAMTAIARADHLLRGSGV